MDNLINQQESIQEDVGICEGLRICPGFAYCIFIFFQNFEEIYLSLFCILLCGSLGRHTDSSIDWLLQPVKAFAKRLTFTHVLLQFVVIIVIHLTC